MLGRKVFIDIETLPPEKHLIRLPPPVRLEDMTDEEYRRLALDGKYGRLLCIGLIVEEDGTVTHRGLFGRERGNLRFHLDEAKTLQAFWNFMRSFNVNRDLLIGFNVLDFDLHFLCQRSVILNVQPSINFCFARYRSSPIYDCMWEFEHWRQRISLDEVANVLGFESSKGEGLDGKSVYDYFLMERHLEIADYCLRDVELTRKIFYRLRFDHLGPERLLV